MKKIILLIITIIISNNLFSQDIIVTNAGDTLNSKITKIKGEYVYFTFKHKNEIRNTLLPLSQVKHYQYDYFQQSDIPAGKVIGYKNYSQFRFAIQGGWSYRVAKLSKDIPADFKQYMRKLKSGYNFGGDVSYYFSEPLGVGFKYSLYKISNEIDNIYVDKPDGSRDYGRMKDDISISFVGPMFSARLFNAKKENAFLMNLSIGYLGYKNNSILIDKYVITGSTLGTCWDFSYDIGLSESISLGLQLSLLSGILRKFDIDDGVKTTTVKLEDDDYENLSRIDLSVGIRFHK